MSDNTCELNTEQSVLHSTALVNINLFFKRQLQFLAFSEKERDGKLNCWGRVPMFLVVNCRVGDWWGSQVGVLGID